jgi:hypothetical protein
MEENSFEAYSYRTNSRFGSRVKISVDDETVTLIGPRIGTFIYSMWIKVQIVLLWLIIPVLIAAVVYRDWKFLVLTCMLAIIHWFVGGAGAGCLWEMANLNAFAVGVFGKTISFPLKDVKDVKIGRGWARKGMWLVIPHFIPGVNKWAEGYCVSFEAPDGEKGKEVVYALHMRTEEDARSLKKLLVGEEAG